MNIHWSKESLERLIEIEEFIAMDNIQKAEEFTDFLIEKSVVLEDNPEIGRIVPEFSDSRIRELIIKGYRLVYRVTNDRIDILTVFEGHRLIRKSEIYND